MASLFAASGVKLESSTVSGGTDFVVSVADGFVGLQHSGLFYLMHVDNATKDKDWSICSFNSGTNTVTKVKTISRVFGDDFVGPNTVGLGTTYDYRITTTGASTFHAVVPDFSCGMFGEPISALPIPAALLPAFPGFVSTEELDTAKAVLFYGSSGSDVAAESLLGNSDCLLYLWCGPQEDEASYDDRYIALDLRENQYVVAASGSFFQPILQDSGYDAIGYVELPAGPGNPPWFGYKGGTASNAVVVAGAIHPQVMGFINDLYRRLGFDFTLSSATTIAQRIACQPTLLDDTTNSAFTNSSYGYLAGSEDWSDANLHTILQNIIDALVDAYDNPQGSSSSSFYMWGDIGATKIGISKNHSALVTTTAPGANTVEVMQLVGYKGAGIVNLGIEITSAGSSGAEVKMCLATFDGTNFNKISGTDVSFSATSTGNKYNASDFTQVDLVDDQIFALVFNNNANTTFRVSQQSPVADLAYHTSTGALLGLRGSYTYPSGAIPSSVALSTFSTARVAAMRVQVEYV